MAGIAYYNEINPYCAGWLRNLIKAGAIAYGHVDERSIEDVRPTDLTGYSQCHFFAGIGVWSRALRTAGWEDDRPIWTASCPCQPFSQAGEGVGFADERHLWPTLHWLAEQCRPATIVGEQVASSYADSWIDLVQADMEALGYAFGSVPFPSAGIGAPHIRDRNYWVGIPANVRRPWVRAEPEYGESGQTSKSIFLRLGDPSRTGLDKRISNTRIPGVPVGKCERQAIIGTSLYLDASNASSPTNGHWRDADWLGCTDGKWRPVEPWTFPLVNGSSSAMGRVRADQGHRAGRLKGYGNAINLWAAVEFINSFKEQIV